MQKQSNNAKKSGFLLIVAVFGATLFGCSGNTPNNTTITTTVPASTPSPSPPIETTVEEKSSNKSDNTDKTQTGKNVIAVESLTSEYEKSKENVQKKYDGKEITVRGFASIPATITADGDGSGLLGITVKGDLLKDVKCWFSKAEAEEFKKIKGDQFVTVKGIFDGELFPELKFCKLIKIE